MYFNLFDDVNDLTVTNMHTDTKEIFSQTDRHGHRSALHIVKRRWFYSVQGNFYKLKSALQKLIITKSITLCTGTTYDAMNVFNLV